jgi:hypothetical protein
VTGDRGFGLFIYSFGTLGVQENGTKKSVLLGKNQIYMYVHSSKCSGICMINVQLQLVQLENVPKNGQKMFVNCHKIEGYLGR